MREAINNNPVVQAAVIGVLALGGVLMFVMGPMAKKDDAASSGAGVTPVGATVTGSGAGAVVTPAGTTPGLTDPAAAAAAAPGAVTPATTGTVSPEALIPGPGLPADLAHAYARGDAVVLLIVKEGATDDDLVRASVSQISQAGVTVFVAPASKVARYSRIAQGVGVNRVPALIVIRPKRGGGDGPEATVSYGFRNTQSVVQAVEDALYRGSDDVPYHPG